MKQLQQKIMFAALLLSLFTLPAFAASTSISENELERILAPIALFPDSLLGNILTAATRPDEVVAADAWIAEHPDLPADKIMKECESQKWDPSVKALLLVPETLEQMCNNMTWTQEVGNAFVDQNDAVFKAIQKLRKKAKDAGNLKDSSDVKVVTDKNGSISIGTTDPNVIIVPRYSPTVVYTASPKVDTSLAIIWGCVFVADVVYECCVWDWYNHHYWLGPGYNHCYYYGGVFYPWGPRCYVPPPLHHHGPPPPPYHPHHPPHYDPHHPPHYDGHSHQPPHHHRPPDYHGRPAPPPPPGHHGQPGHVSSQAKPAPSHSIKPVNAANSPKSDPHARPAAKPRTNPGHFEGHSKQRHTPGERRHRLSSSSANLIPRQTIDSMPASSQQAAFPGSRQHSGSGSAISGGNLTGRPGSARNNLTQMTGNSSDLGHFSSPSRRSGSGYSPSGRQNSLTDSSRSNISSGSGRSFSSGSRSSANHSISSRPSRSSSYSHGSRSSRHGRR